LYRLIGSVESAGVSCSFWNIYLPGSHVLVVSSNWFWIFPTLKDFWGIVLENPLIYQSHFRTYLGHLSCVLCGNLMEPYVQVGIYIYFGILLFVKIPSWVYIVVLNYQALKMYPIVVLSSIVSIPWYNVVSEKSRCEFEWIFNHRVILKIKLYFGNTSFKSHGMV
jgi:hypothetical protein